MSEGLDLALDAVAVHRLTRLIVEDAITKPARDAVAEASEDHPWVRKVDELVTCWWCTSVWVAAGVVVVRDRRWWRRVRLVWVFSAITGAVGSRL
jgi:hypothetical protein